ncbi:MAG: KTSC domain-containing protein [Clostridium chrysemydis]|uniref:KTSC domain-containing protein n=1 Tax=Clostridium chrysemydis TaxID=2665504 RepID=UPI003F2DEF2C
MIEIDIKESKNLKKAYFHNEKNELWIIFNSNQIYKYENVTFETVLEFQKSENSGEFFYHNIRDKFKYRKV